MKIFWFLNLAITLFTFAQNNYPIVFVHGFMGWGPGEMGDYNYWGGKKDFLSSLKSQGHEVFEVSVGPVSSNWERAIECYYQIKGGQVDYGKRHSDKYNVIQKPSNKNYTGLYPNWDSNSPIHIIGHSMGGQTARMLQHILSTEFFIEEKSGVKEDSKLLSTAQSGMLKSITTISTPHDGTTLTEIVTKSLPFLQYFVGVAGIVGNSFYNFDLEHMRFTKDEEESWLTYIERMRNHTAWSTKNISGWDLSLDGARELNGILNASPETFYFSFATSTTKKNIENKYHSPVKNTPIMIKTRSKLIGFRTGYWFDGSKTDSLWYENDGVVNTISMYGPTSGINGADPIVKYESNDLLIPGQWNWIKIPDMDHWSVIGHMGSSERIKRAQENLINHANRLRKLPK